MFYPLLRMFIVLSIPPIPQPLSPKGQGERLLRNTRTIIVSLFKISQSSSLFYDFFAAMSASHTTPIVKHLLGTAVNQTTDGAAFFAPPQNCSTFASSISTKTFWLDSKTML